jgi:acetylornithine/N-succinyldiaminopimelate aminotransferase
VTLVPGDHGTTFGGNPFATRTALAVLETIEQEHLVANAHAMGQYFVQRLQDPALKSKIKEIRGLGLMIGVELVKPEAKRVQSDALKNGLVLNAVGDTTLRFLPPLIITKADVDQAIEILKSVV